MLRRNRREERREDRHDVGGGAGPAHYKMRQDLVSFGDDYWIEDERGAPTRWTARRCTCDTLVIRRADGAEVARIQEKMVRVKDTMDIEGPAGGIIASVKKALITPVRERWVVKIGAGPDLEVQGNILDHEYTIGDGAHRVAEISKKWFRVADSYGVEIAGGQDEGLILAVTVAVDMMSHPAR